MEVLVIGPEPPCIRCSTAHRLAKEVGEQFPGKVEVRRISAYSEEAKKYGKIEGGHHIASAYNVSHDHEKIESVFEKEHFDFFKRTDYYVQSRTWVPNPLFCLYQRVCRPDMSLWIARK